LLKEVFVDRACSSIEYPGLCQEKAIQMCKQWGVLDDDTVAHAFELANQDLADFSDDNNQRA